MNERNWDAMKRPLLLLRFLREGSADRFALMAAIRNVLPTAYSEGSEKQQARTFERDLENVRQRLGAKVVWQPRLRQYVLLDGGPFVLHALPPEALSSLAFLQDSFTTSEAIQREIRPLLDWVSSSNWG